ncbi:hypothetical protein E4T56_gene7669 [Termitomyces sp. T112]|nr:hypothetical protein E4T56_gene7669 [Termitomyces sp. T112]
MSSSAYSPTSSVLSALQSASPASSSLGESNPHYGRVKCMYYSQLSAAVAGPSGVSSGGVAPPASASAGHSSQSNFSPGQVMAVLEALRVAQADVTPERQRPCALSAPTMGNIVSSRSQCRGPVGTPLFAFLAVPGMRSAPYH